MTGPVPVIYREPERAARIALIAESYARLLGQPLTGEASDVLAALWASPLAIVAHGTETDPIFFFGNAAALTAFETDVEAFTRIPSRLSAEAPLREERQALLDRVTANGFIDDYAGVRISAKGKRFHIGPAVVWNLADAEGRRHGQAACFAP
ncbi:MEKHLA domain-containing protein [Novosphingobium album (ex Hu et al. 2023)]|uniref:MEKHLA domain-containing protein n=1 Tax=Novosphingobium album (ex Hu et al. 2023) TaxID=2930093 RepID=A0ABT0AX76_9SPHN|nr:MEKHLA domain-containing protein [Novosphingobium album (ex Hu et al. 2023)]MCJ2177427.1 MEKHLA domain-containing protein [Novosphingobium album (ex Hu et al. 2023)]